MKQHVHDARDGWFYHLESTCKQTFCFLAAHLIVGSIFVEGLVRFGVTVMHTLIEASQYMHLEPRVNTRQLCLFILEKKTCKYNGILQSRFWYNTFVYYFKL